MTPGPASGLAAHPGGMLSGIPARGDSGAPWSRISSGRADRPMTANNAWRDLQIIHKNDVAGGKGRRPRGGLRLTSAAGGLKISHGRGF